MVRYLVMMQRIDRRVMYALLILVIAIPFFVRLKTPTAVTAQVQAVYDQIEAIPPDKAAILSGDWSAGTIAENLPQAEALFRHLFRKNIRILVLPFSPQNATLMQDVGERIAEEHFKKYGVRKQYGVDWINWGWKAAPPFAFLKSMAKDIPGTVKVDYQGKPVTSFEVMRGINNIEDIGFVAQITPTASLDVWIAAIQTVYGTPLAYAPTAVMVAQGYDPLDAKQIVGMLPGLVGGAQYEVLLDHPGRGLRWSNALSFAEILMIVLIVLANIGYSISKKQGTGT